MSPATSSWAARAPDADETHRQQYLQHDKGIGRRCREQLHADLARHTSLRYRFLSSGKLEEWVLPGLPPQMPVALVCNNMEAMLGAAIAGMGLAYLPDFLARDALARGELRQVLAEHLTHTGQFSALWPSSRQLSPKVRAFVDFAGERLFSA